MDILPTQLIGSISWAGVGALFVWVVLKPLTLLAIAKLNKTDILSYEKLRKLETNDLIHIEKRLGALEDQVRDFSSFQKTCLDAQNRATEQFGMVRADIATLMERTKK